VRKGGLEPPHLSVPDPKSGASANSATFATTTGATASIAYAHIQSHLSGFAQKSVQQAASLLMLSLILNTLRDSTTGWQPVVRFAEFI
jgi:hypothetical protein